LEKERPGILAKAFQTHPQTPDRIQKSQREINTLLPPRDEYKVDTSEFEEVKARLAQIENRHKINNGTDSGRPTLRRRGGSKPDEGNGKSGDDVNDRPTLKRRSNNPS